MILLLASVHGSPGVTTTAVGMAHLWPRPVVIIENAVGSPILAGYGRGAYPHDRGVVNLIRGFNDDRWDQAVDAASVRLSESVSVIPGFTSADQALTVDDGVWAALAGPLQEMSATHGMDVIIDAGRYPMASFPTSLLSVATATRLFVRSTLPDVTTTMRSVASFRRYTQPDTLRAVVVGPNRPYPVSTIGDLLNLPVDTLAWDPKTAAVYSLGEQPNRRHQGAPLMNSLRKLSEQLSVNPAELVEAQ